jgi:hypothetical protein
MKAITFDFCSNLGGVSKLYAIPPALLEAVTHNYTKKESYLNLTNTDDMIEIYCTIDTILFSEEKSQQSSGGAYNIEISGVIPKANELNQEQLDRLESEYWLVLFEDNNGNIRLSGDEESHLIFNRTDNTGKGMAARNQVDFTFSGMQSHSSYFIYKIFTAL